MKTEKISGAAGEVVSDGEAGASGLVAAASGFQARGISDGTGYVGGVDTGSLPSGVASVKSTPPAIAGLLWKTVPSATEHQDVAGLHNTLVLAAFIRGQVGNPRPGIGAVEDPEPATDPVAPPCVTCSAESDGECENCGAPLCVNHDSGEYTDVFTCSDMEGCSARCADNQRPRCSVCDQTLLKHADGSFSHALIGFDARKAERLGCAGHPVPKPTALESALATLDRLQEEIGKAEPVPMGALLIMRERRRQVFEEGWDAAHDDQHVNGELAAAAVSYVLQMYKAAPWALGLEADGEDCWPFEWAWFKPKTAIRDLVRAGAFIAAEIDRIQRVEAAAATKLSKEGSNEV